MSFDDLKQKVREESSADSTGDSEDSEEYEERPYLKMAPTTAITGTFEDLFFTGKVSDNGGNPIENQTYGSFGFVLDDPTTVRGTIFENHLRDDADLARFHDDVGDEDEQSTDFRLFDEEDSSFEQNYDADGNLKGVKGGYSDEFNGSAVDEIGEDTVTVFMGGTAGREAARALDANGVRNAHAAEGVNTRGLIEWPTSEQDDDLQPRVARYPDAREDLLGEEITILVGNMSDFNEDYSGGALTSLVFKGEVEWDNIGEGTIVEAVEDREAVEYDATLAWHAEATETDDSGSESGSSGDEDFDLADDSDGTDTSLTEAEETFVGVVVDEVGDGSIDDTFDDFGRVVEKNRQKNGGDLSNDVSVDTFRSAIEAGL